MLCRARVQCHVTEFAAGARRLAVEMEVSVWNGQNFGRGGSFADQIQHGGVAESSCGTEGEAAASPEVIFKLAGDRAFDGPVAGIVNARSHLVGEEFAVQLE